MSVEDPYLGNSNQKTIDYLLSLDPEKFLYSFYKQAGLTPTTAAGYGGWERDDEVRAAREADSRRRWFEALPGRLRG